jgi:hypothetical protein
VPQQGAAEAELVGLGAEGFDAEGDVVVQGDIEFGGAFDYVVATDAAGEGFIFEALFDGADFEVEDAF